MENGRKRNFWFINNPKNDVRNHFSRTEIDIFQPNYRILLSKRSPFFPRGNLKFPHGEWGTQITIFPNIPQGGDPQGTTPMYHGKSGKINFPHNF